MAQKGAVTLIQQFILWVKRLFRRRPQARDEAQAAQETAERYEDISKINFTAIFANKLTNLVVAESTVSIKGDNGTNKRAEFVDAAIQNVWKKARKITAQTFGKGGKVIVPYIENGRPRFSIIDQHRMIISGISDDQVVSATLVADVIKRDNDTRKYYRLADYSVENGVHRIVNRAVNDSGASVALTDFPEWAGIAEEIAISNVDRPLFAFIRCPVDNRVDKNVYGVPVTFGSESVIAETVEHLSVIKREYKLTRPMLGLDSTLWRKKKSSLKDEDGNPIPFGKTIEDVRTTVQDNDFPFIPVDTIDGDQPWLMFAPAIRDSAMYARLQELFALVEKSVGTSKGILTERQSVGATATEIRASQYDTFCIVDAMREEWEAAIDDLAYAYDVLAEYFGLTPAGSRGSYTIAEDWDYSMYESSAETFSQLSELQSRGMLRKARLYQWVNGGTLEDAQKVIDEVTEFDGNGSPFGD